MPRSLPLVFALAVSSVVSTGCKKSPPENVAAVVNGHSITFAELDKQYQTQFSTPTDRTSDDQVMIQKLEVLRSLMDNEIMLQRAEKAGLMAVDADVDFVSLNLAEGWDACA